MQMFKYYIFVIHLHNTILTYCILYKWVPYFTIFIYTESVSIGNLLIHVNCSQVFNPLNKWTHTFIFLMLQYFSPSKA